jgi:hypothetical protein
MTQQFQRQGFRKPLTREERNKKYGQPKPVTLWDMLDEKSRKRLLDIQAKALIKNPEVRIWKKERDPNQIYV